MLDPPTGIGPEPEKFGPGLFFTRDSTMLRHTLSDINEDDRTATCGACGPQIRIKKKGKKRNGSIQWCCVIAARERAKPHHHHRYFYKKFKKDRCERCPFVPEDLCQLDVHHKDGNRKNNDPDNLVTLCANCHRIVTKMEKQGFYGYHEVGQRG